MDGPIVMNHKPLMKILGYLLTVLRLNPLPIHLLRIWHRFGLLFIVKDAYPNVNKNSVFIAFHGSWNRSIPAGYKVVRLKLNQRGNIISHSDFITGWLGNNGLAIGRPVDIETSPEGDLYLSDDFLGVIYKISSLQNN